MDVVARPMGHAAREGFVSTDLPGWSDWTTRCDEGANGGGEDAAPSPLMYVTAGVAFCLLAHVGTSAKLLGLELTSYRLEQQDVSFTTSNFDDMHLRDLRRAGQVQETHPFTESVDPDRNLTEFVQCCARLHGGSVDQAGRTDEDAFPPNR